MLLCMLAVSMPNILLVIMLRVSGCMMRAQPTIKSWLITFELACATSSINRFAASAIFKILLLRVEKVSSG